MGVRWRKRFRGSKETSGSEAANFNFNNGKRNWNHQSNDNNNRALPVRSGKWTSSHSSCPSTSRYSTTSFAAGKKDRRSSGLWALSSSTILLKTRSKKARCHCLSRFPATSPFSTREGAPVFPSATMPASFSPMSI